VYLVKAKYISTKFEMLTIRKIESGIMSRGLLKTRLLFVCESSLEIAEASLGALGRLVHERGIRRQKVPYGGRIIGFQNNLRNRIED
jgi:hypothetical protein